MSSGGQTSANPQDAAASAGKPTAPFIAPATSAPPTMSQQTAPTQPSVVTPANMAPPNAPQTPAVTTPRYQPQFTTATQMILKKMKGEQVSLSSAFSSSYINPAAFEAAKSRMRESLNTTTGPPAAKAQSPSLLRMPTPSPSTSTPRVPHALLKPSQYLHMPPTARSNAIPSSARPGAHMSAIQKVNAGLTPSGKPRPEAKARISGGIPTPVSAIKKTKTPTSGKRKRGKGDGSVSESSDTESGSASVPRMTKSGRHVTKPLTYNPSEIDDIHRRARGTNFGSRTAEQAMCRRCSRLAYNDENQIVFCDGCEGAWHQMCHQPRIAAQVLGDVNAKWYCVDCAAKREKHGSHKRVKVEERATKTSWADRTNGQKRAYLSGLPPTSLIEMIMGILEQQPDLPIFPSDDSPAASHNTNGFFAGGSTDGLFSRSEANPMSTLNYIRKISAAAGANGRSAGHGNPTRFELTPFDAISEDPEGLLDAWPKPGEGSAYDKLEPEDLCGVMTDDYDDEVVRHTVWENGIPRPVGPRPSQG